ncbi:MAG: mitochondrial fission ELM1 family protein [Alphaproteobacteria bacterium]|nr:mitochondrial fission ELM1 family protein [Alphaproteobacteria bacterium]
MSRPRCWVIYDKGKVGTGNQCIGLAQSLGLDYVVYEIQAKFPWKYIPSSCWIHPLSCVTCSDEAFLKLPWPDVVIGAGRASAAPVAAMGQLSAGKTKTIQILNPRLPCHLYDAVIAPEHDQYTGPNVFQTKGALHRLNHQLLAEESEKFKDHVASVSKPFIVVLMGGGGRRFRLDPDVIYDLRDKLKDLMDKSGGHIAIVPSRRTGEKNKIALNEAFKGMDVEIWDGSHANPYLGYLGLADYIVVTSDSVSMVSEACYTGKPVYIYHLPGGSSLFDRFHNLMEKEGYTRRLSHDLQVYNYPALDEMSRVTEWIQIKMVI